MTKTTKVKGFSMSVKPDSNIMYLWIKLDMKDADLFERKEETVMNDRVTLTTGGFHYSLTNIKFQKYYPSYFNTEINLVFTAEYKKTEMVYPFGFNPFTDDIQPQFNI